MSSLQKDSSHDDEIVVPPFMMDAFTAGYEKAVKQMQKKFGGVRQQMSHTTRDSAFFTRSLRANRDSENPHSNSHLRAEEMRRNKKSVLREEARSKLR
jgi:hypothetical protein